MPNKLKIIKYGVIRGWESKLREKYILLDKLYKITHKKYKKKLIELTY